MFLDCWSSASLGVSFPEYRSPGPPCSWCKEPSWVSVVQLQGSTTGLVGQGHCELWNQPDLGKRLLLFMNFYSITFWARFFCTGTKEMHSPERIRNLYIQNIQGHISLTSIWVLTWLHKESPRRTVAASSYSIYPFIPHKMEEMQKQITNPNGKQSPHKNHKSLSLITPCKSQASPKDQTNKWADCTMSEGHKIGITSDHMRGEKNSKPQNTLRCAEFQKTSFSWRYISSSPSPFLLGVY